MAGAAQIGIEEKMKAVESRHASEAGGLSTANRGGRPS
jgi:hypothetical protein